jgi:nucleoside-diphosphate-sugar epimerase
MRSLITGGTGYIGQHLAQELLSRGEEVSILALPGADDDGMKEKGVDVYFGDVRDPDAIRRALRGCSRVYHLAAYARNWARDEDMFFDINVRGTRTVLEAAAEAGVSKLVHVSSNVVLGPSNGSWVCEDALRVNDFLTPYERSKFAADSFVRAFALRGLEFVIVYPTRVFGPGLAGESNSVTKMIQLYLKGRWRIIPGNGRCLGNYVYVDDLAKGIVLAMERGRHGNGYIIGGENVTFTRFFDEIRQLSGKRFALVHLPLWLALAFGFEEAARARLFRGYPTITPGWVRTLLGDWGNSIDKARRELGYVSTPFSVALKSTIDWLENSNGRVP